MNQNGSTTLEDIRLVCLGAVKFRFASDWRRLHASSQSVSTWRRTLGLPSFKENVIYELSHSLVFRDIH